MQDQYVSEQKANNEKGPLVMNAFEMITLSQGLNLSALFDRRLVCVDLIYFNIFCCNSCLITDKVKLINVYMCFGILHY